MKGLKEKRTTMELNSVRCFAAVKMPGDGHNMTDSPRVDAPKGLRLRLLASGYIEMRVGAEVELIGPANVKSASVAAETTPAKTGGK